MATGEFIGLLDHDDALAPFALFEVVQALNQQRFLIEFFCIRTGTRSLIATEFRNA